MKTMMHIGNDKKHYTKVKKDIIDIVNSLSSCEVDTEVFTEAFKTYREVVPAKNIIVENCTFKSK
jgi:uncharacterized protein YktA (UPF0223 family)